MDEKELISNEITEMVSYFNNVFDVNEFREVMNDLIDDHELINCDILSENSFNNSSTGESVDVRSSYTINSQCFDIERKLDMVMTDNYYGINVSSKSYDGILNNYENKSIESTSNDSSSVSSFSDEDDLISKLKKLKKSKPNSIERHFSVNPEQFPVLMCSLFNARDMDKLTSLFKSTFHSNAYIGCNKPGYSGFDNMNEFIDKFYIGYKLFNNSVMSLKDMKTIKSNNPNDKNTYITFKVRFSGTSSFALLPRENYCKTESVTVLMDKKSHKEEEINKLKYLEETLIKSGLMVSFFMKFSYSLCIDHKTNLISYGMIDFKLSSFKPIFNYCI